MHVEGFDAEAMVDDDCFPIHCICFCEADGAIVYRIYRRAEDCMEVRTFVGDGRGALATRTTFAGVTNISVWISDENLPTKGIRECRCPVGFIFFCHYYCDARIFFCENRDDS